MKILVLGATGLVGGHVISQAIEQHEITHIIAPVRKQLSIHHPKLTVPMINFDDFAADAKAWEFDAVICALGTTMKKAKSKAAFKQIDYDYPLAFAKLAQEKNAKIFALNSAMGVSSNSPFFYSKVKGELEQQLQKMGFESLTFVRPGLIEGQRDEVRVAEEIGLKLSKLLKPILPKNLQPNKAEAIARVLLQAVLQSSQGVKIIEAKDIH